MLVSFYSQYAVLYCWTDDVLSNNPIDCMDIMGTADDFVCGMREICAENEWSLSLEIAVSDKASSLYIVVSLSLAPRSVLPNEEQVSTRDSKKIVLAILRENIRRLSLSTSLSIIVAWFAAQRTSAFRVFR